MHHLSLEERAVGTRIGDDVSNLLVGKRPRRERAQAEAYDVLVNCKAAHGSRALARLFLLGVCSERAAYSIVV